MTDSTPATAASSPVTEPCPHCGCPVAPSEWFEDDEGTLSCTCCALRDECDPNDPDCTCRREDAIVQEHADAGTESAWDEGLMRLTVPLGDGRQAFVLAPAGGLSAGDAERVATVVREWRLPAENDDE